MEFLLIIFAISAVLNFIGKKKREEQKREQARRAAEAAPHAQGAPREDARFPTYGAPQAAAPVRPRAYTEDPRFPSYEPPQAAAAPRARTANEDPRFPAYEPPESYGAADRQQAAEAERVRAQTEAEARRAAYQQRLREQRAQRTQQPPQQASGIVGDRLQSNMQSHMESHVGSRLGSRLQELEHEDLKATKGRRHTLEASSISGHAHVENSLDGHKNAHAPAPKPIAVQPVAAEMQASQGTPGGYAIGRLLRNNNAIVQGVLMHEVLGKPKALRR